MVPLCRDHHRLVEDDWSRAGVGAKSQPPTVLHLVALGMSRWAMFLGRLAAAEVLTDLLTPLATWLADHALMLRDVAACLDEYSGPDWRNAPGIAPEPS